MYSVAKPRKLRAVIVVCRSRIKRLGIAVPFNGIDSFQTNTARILRLPESANLYISLQKASAARNRAAGRTSERPKSAMREINLRDIFPWEAFRVTHHIDHNAHNVH